jgi:hypothetical protein
MEGTVAYYRVHGANAHRETAQRRKWPLRKLAVAQANVAQRHALIREFAVRQGRPEPEPGRWISGADLFERLLLRRAAPTVKEAWDTSLAAVWTKTWSEAGVRPGLRLRTIVLAVVVAAAPRFLLRRLYPNLF